ncbi:hypothetical protein EUX98_g3459 [Antrodiella citrinella]|uniref:Holocytochrome c-type synthase n=1 Tax=Antrodiella citrinella TaxID=2447956 RepID=A0A4S4MWI0_9APHY|nr:hypothetical protein EUX98_g3459 [Antrodiella citrinella]
MPSLSQAPAENQTADLPVDREVSSIPRDSSAKWEYPSPQQFYNALVRKGWETPEEHVETMVQIHNFLNEQAWLEILKWEKKVNPAEDPQLARFKGRPGEISPKARFWLFAGWLLPSRFNSEPPFDRHDWIVKRGQTGEEVRYVIDYYSAPPEPDGSPVFSLDSHHVYKGRYMGHGFASLKIALPSRPPRPTSRVQPQRCVLSIPSVSLRTSIPPTHTPPRQGVRFPLVLASQWGRDYQHRATAMGA